MSNGTASPNVAGTFATLWWAFLLGIGFHLGWGMVSLIVGALAAAVGAKGPELLN
jgi:hypothetical protein